MTKRIKTIESVDSWSWTQILLLVSCGFLVFSPVSSFISQSILGLPLSLPELFFLPYFFYLRKIFDFKINVKILVAGLLIILALIAIAMLVGNFGLFAILSTARSYFYMLLAYAIFKNKKIDTLFHVMHIAVGTVLGWLSISLYNINALMLDVEGGRIIAYGNMLALSLAVSIPIIFDKVKIKYLIFVCGIILSATSGIRRQILVFLVSYLSGVILSMRGSLTKVLKAVGVLVFLSAILIAIYPIFEEKVRDVSPQLHFRVFVASATLMSEGFGATESDQVRSGIITIWVDSLEDSLFPKGFVSRQIGTDRLNIHNKGDVGVGIFKDFPLLELTYTYGIIVVLFFILFFMRCIFFHLRKYYIEGIRESAVCLVSALIICALFMIEGSFLGFVYATPFTGFVFARIFSRRNLVA